MALVERHQRWRKEEDRRAGEMIAIFYNANRNEEKDPEGWVWQDVFPEWKEDTEQTEEQMLAHMKLWSSTTKALPS